MRYHRGPRYDSNRLDELHKLWWVLMESINAPSRPELERAFATIPGYHPGSATTAYTTGDGYQWFSRATFTIVGGSVYICFPYLLDYNRDNDTPSDRHTAFYTRTCGEFPEGEIDKLIGQIIHALSPEAGRTVAKQAISLRLVIGGVLALVILAMFAFGVAQH